MSVAENFRWDPDVAVMLRECPIYGWALVCVLEWSDCVHWIATGLQFAQNGLFL